MESVFMKRGVYKILVSVVFLLGGKMFLFSQTNGVNRGKYQIHIKMTDQQIELDGVFDEAAWKTAEIAHNFHRVTPTDTGYAIAQTEVRVSYDQDNLYVAAICYDPIAGKRPIQSLRRDWSFSSNDNFMFFLDTYNDLTNGFAFGVSEAGVQRDGIESDGDEVAYSWDTKWKSVVKSYDDRWTTEISIPFRSLRYFDGSKIWGINFGRLDLKTNEKSAWAPMPRQFKHNNLAFAGTLIWGEPLQKAGMAFSLIPYAAGMTSVDNQADGEAKWSGNAGFDAKMILSTSLNLDITVNPDFSQVEVDEQVTNLDRFELFFPERRQFFLENTDLFANLGNSGIQPFFSRRIGLNVPVIAGGRLSGKLGKQWRIGVMDMQTSSQDVTPSTNFAAAVLQRRIFSRSNIVGFLVNKLVTDDQIDPLYAGKKSNTVAGLEYNMASPDDRWTGKVFYHQAFYPGASGNAAATSGSITYSTKYFRATFDQAWVGADYIAEVGFIRRKGYLQSSPTLEYTFYPSNSKILTHGPSADFSLIFNPQFKMTDRQIQLLYSIGWKSRNELTFKVNEQFVKLNRSFDPTNTGGTRLEAGSDHHWRNAEVNWSSDSRRLLNYTFAGGYGGYFNGTRLTFGTEINYRVQPYGSLSIIANYNDISLPEPYGSAKLFLIGPKLDLTLTDKFFITTFAQFNNQIDNLNLNIRLQWRFAPVSDLFIIYTGNSSTGDFSNKNRGLAIKLSYWFN
ncbi:MAG: carbohydrate binding family 9 domain-containing protein [Saprospiraceae bacterium]|nr:carbohydrate binding family 9 domain-containing protein [Saprospiraceae bacterium]